MCSHDDQPLWKNPNMHWSVFNIEHFANSCIAKITVFNLLKKISPCLYIAEILCRDFVTNQFNSLAIGGVFFHPKYRNSLVASVGWLQIITWKNWCFTNHPLNKLLGYHDGMQKMPQLLQASLANWWKYWTALLRKGPWVGKHLVKGMLYNLTGWLLYCIVVNVSSTQMQHVARSVTQHNHSHHYRNNNLLGWHLGSDRSSALGHLELSNLKSSYMMYLKRTNWPKASSYGVYFTCEWYLRIL